MSTKIYNAYKYKGKLPELMVELKKLRELYLSTEFVKEVYKLKMNLYEVVHEGIYRSIEVVEETLKNDCIILYEYKSKLYIHLFCGYNRKAEAIILEYLDSNESFEDFHYQDNADKPDEVSDYLWDKREKTWDHILPNTPAEAGLCWQLYSKGCYNSAKAKLLDN